MNKNSIKHHKIGFWSIVLLGVNAIIGSGIFLLPNVGMKLFGPASIIVLLFDALLAFVIALCFAECASFFSKTGGPYLYAKAAFGNFVGYEVGFVTWAIRIIAEGTMYVAFAIALSGFFPPLAHPMAKNIIVTILAIALMILNISGVRLTTLINNVVTVGKIVPILLVIIVGLFFINGSNFHPFFIPNLTHTSNFATAAITLFYIFTGFEGVVVIAGEMDNAKKNLPKALVLSLLCVAITYIAIMIVSIGVLGPDLAKTAVPLKSVFEKLVGPWGGMLISLGMILSVGGICVASSFITPRSGVALAEQKMMPAILAKTNRRQAPYVAIIVSTCISLIIAYSGTFTALAQISAVSRFAQYIPTCLAVLVFRRTKQQVGHSFKIPFGPLVPILALLTSGWLLFHIQTSNVLWGLGALVVAIPFYFITRQKNQSN
ncbi:APC family permease [Convivina intestini]|uniref:Amino acid/polyamine/organocation transporter (APC superfamily) n=1 Tax=Convivina intestini TaxID=1505726 RepID=A0A2U1DF08_9LACO|nr:APC family permease [Convivina intestini]PVY86265.1 amino acid/polyamine/organocation transporter (APC superfamily) [Convivina intestini]CAH1851142.1 putative transporter [Convivina intestini]SDB81997.1 amino acid/polyamine/organocation transporter, APC superfamily (TC 2.A.3) [Leuconostocaceae bacterium R-53105]